MIANKRILSAAIATSMLLALGLADEDKKSAEVYTTVADREPLFRKPVQTHGIHGRLDKGTELTVVATRGAWKEVKGDKLAGWILGSKNTKLPGTTVSLEYRRARAVAKHGSGLVTKGFSKKYARSHGIEEEQSASLERTFTTPNFDMETYDKFVGAASLEGSRRGKSSAPAAQSEPKQEPKPKGKTIPGPKGDPFGDKSPFGEDDTLNEMKAGIALKKLSKAIADDPHYFARNMTYSEEEEMGFAIASRLAAGKILDNAELSAYVSMIGSALLQHSDRADIPYVFTILASDDINAFAAPGGYIFITTGAIKACEDEAELAAVIAHEIAHIARRHGLRTLDQNRLNISKKMMGAEMGRVIEKYYGPMDPDDAALIRELQSLADGAFETVTGGWNHEFELEADEYGMRYLARAGWDHRGMMRFLNVLKDQESGHVGHAWSTHPPAQERVEKLNSVVRRGKWRARDNSQKKRFMHYRALLK